MAASVEQAFLYTPNPLQCREFKNRGMAGKINHLTMKPFNNHQPTINN